MKAIMMMTMPMMLLLFCKRQRAVKTGPGEKEKKCVSNARFQGDTRPRRLWSYTVFCLVIHLKLNYVAR